MRSPLLSRPARFVLGLVLGISAGLAYAWLVQPVRYYDVAPDSLRQDYRSDYILMIAQSYQAEGDLRLALLRLATLGPLPPASIVEQAAAYAEEQAFAAADIEALLELRADLSLLPSGSGTASP